MDKGHLMAMFCPACGNAARPNARFCDGCGQSLTEGVPAEAPQITSLRTEYTQVHLDWSANGIRYDDKKKIPDPLSPSRARVIAEQRVTSELNPTLQQGWSFDGPFDAAVQWEMTHKEHFFGEFYGWYRGANVKLRRVTG
jgi:hypothetical protein